MENKINIAEILRDMPKGTKLYSPLFGKCKLVGVDTDEDGDFICVETFFQDERVRESRTFSSDGRYFGWYEDEKCMLFPSDRMRCWSKFFKRGDVVSDDDMDFIWFYMRRDIFKQYFYELNGKKNTHFGYEDFMHALAALHRGNRYMVTFYSEIEHKQLQALCYRFDGEYHPLCLYIDGKVVGKTKKSSGLQSFNAFVPNEWIKAVAKHKTPENRHVELGREEWWNDLEIYDNFKTTYNG